MSGDAARTESAAVWGGPQKVLVLAVLVIPGDEGAPVEQIEAYAADALRSAGFFVKRLDADLMEEVLANV
jgi:hypothetical protein